MKNIILYIILFVISVNGLSQAKKRRLPRNINTINYNSYYPAISGDANSLLFLSNFTNSGAPAIHYSYKIDASTWSDPVELPRTLNAGHLLFEGGYSLSFDGKTIFFTSKKSGGIGGYDIWYSKLSGKTWQTPINMKNKINSAAHEGMPSVSSSGQSIYYCRCETINSTKATGCKIMVANRNGSLWESSEPLPDNINQYAPQSPKIMADGETLLFSSAQGGSTDLYLTRKKEDGHWSDPVPMNFVNTTENEQFVSTTAKGRYLYHDVKTEKGRVIEQLLIPDEFTGKKVMHVKGKVNNANTGEGIPSTLKVYEVATRERIVFEELNENSEFNFALKEGVAYDFSVEAKDKSYPYFSKLYVLDNMRTSSRDELKIELSPLARGEEIGLGALNFDAYSAEINDNSTYELRRLLRFLKSNSDKKYNLTIHRYNYLEDSLASNVDLTEVLIDTTWTEVEKIIEVVDTITTEYIVNTIGAASDTSFVSSDSVIYEKRLAVRDSVIMIPQFKLNYTYHNDRTLKQAQNLVLYLREKGIPEEQFIISTTKTREKPPREIPEIIATLKQL
ncbi:MAG: hypothetical protein OEX22_09630 [Cyclobacteriaceae bacterium]|nr:hypothetical protein [Cyclobacteriaceae bacterium]